MSDMDFVGVRRRPPGRGTATADKVKLPWPDELASLVSVYRGADPEADLQPLRERIFVILCLAVHGCVSRSMRRYGLLLEDRDDICSQKTLDLFSRLMSGAWNPEDRSGSDIVGYIATSARHAVVDHLRARRRSSAARVPEDPDEDGSPAARIVEEATFVDEYTNHLLDCLSLLAPRARQIWVFRTFHGLSAREVASLPNVGLREGNVNVIMQRVRSAIGQCLGKKGLDDVEIPPGVYVRVWEACWGTGRRDFYPSPPDGTP